MTDIPKIVYKYENQNVYVVYPL